jgi:hypothetical protein
MCSGRWRLATNFLCISLHIPRDHQSRDSTVNSIRVIKIAICDPDAQQKIYFSSVFNVFLSCCCCCRFTCVNRCARARSIGEDNFINLWRTQNSIVLIVSATCFITLNVSQNSTREWWIFIKDFVFGQGWWSALTAISCFALPRHCWEIPDYSNRCQFSNSSDFITGPILNSLSQQEVSVSFNVNKKFPQFFRFRARELFLLIPQ